MMSEFDRWSEKCSLCPRNCGADRTSGEGACRTAIKRLEDKVLIPVARAALHYWEEPCISGENGSGAVFFSGCSLGCVFCQNSVISRGGTGKYIDEQRLSEIFLELQEQGANNINLVTAGHVLPFVVKALELARLKGLTIPILYNTASYEKVDTIKRLEGLVDIYLPDLKYTSSVLSGRFSTAADYPEVARAAIDEMFRQTGKFVIENGLIKKGLVVRHLVLPGCTEDSKRTIEYLYNRYGDDVYLSIMNQYTPPKKKSGYSVLNRRVRPSEYNGVIEFAVEIGVKMAYMQSSESAVESFIPEFDGLGI